MKVAALKKQQRQHDTGGVYPQPIAVCRTLCNGLHQCRMKNAQHERMTRCEERMLFHFIWIWLTGDLAAIAHPCDIPRLTVLTGSEPCQAHALRRVRLNGISWVEYALPYPTGQGETWLWQPVPDGLNHFFATALSHSTEHWGLSGSDKALFCQRLTQKWRVPAPLRGLDRLRRQRFFDYFRTMAAQDDSLSHLAKRLLIGAEGVHHRNAATYQRQSSNSLRAQIFVAQSRHVERLRLAVANSPLAALLQVPTPGRAEWQPLLQPTTPLPAHLTVAGKIVAYHLDQSAGSRGYTELAALYIGSQRPLAVEQARRFFRHLHAVGEARARAVYRVSTLCDLINFRVYELALLFVALTGTRPTHAISVLRDLCYERQVALIYDKGRWRQVVLCDHLRRAISRLEGLYQRLARMTDLAPTSPLMWYTLQRGGDQPIAALPLCAKTLRKFMAEHWPPAVGADRSAVPYQLRHLFAQHALESSDPRLTPQEIDRLMGHARLGEQLGNANHFPLSQARIARHLAGMVDFLQLPAIDEERP